MQCNVDLQKLLGAHKIRSDYW